MYQSWGSLLPNAELALVQLPGRDSRITENLHTNLYPLIEELADGLVSHLDRPFAFFGHSMGSLLAFETARQLRRKRAAQPVRLFVSARTAPHMPEPHQEIYQLAEPAFIRMTENLYGAMPDVIRQDPEILRLFLQIMRADLTMTGTYNYMDEAPLDIPITVYGGMEDRSVTEAALHTWSSQTTASFRLLMLPGDHFFIQRSRTMLIEDLGKHLFD